MFPCERLPSNCSYFEIGRLPEGIDIHRVQRLVDDLTNPTAEDCKNCWCLRMCGVGCADGIIEDGRVCPAKKKAHCDQVRARRADELVGMMCLLEQEPRALEHFDSVIIQ